MALLHLSEEQIKTWTRQQKDQWWYDNVYRGDMPQLTLRSGLMGFLLGGILSATALYIAAKTGISIGVGLISVILSFALFRLMHGAGIASDMTVLENNCTQSIATAAGYMNGALVTSLTAYMVMTGRILPWWQMLIWMVIISVLGVLVAFPMKRRFINDEQLPFPEGRASGVVLDSLYTGGAAAGMFKARLLAVTAVCTGIYQMLTGDGWMKLIQFKILRMDKWAGMKEPWTFHARLDDYYYEWATKAHLAIPRLLGTDIRQLGWHASLDLSLFGVGGLMGIMVSTSCLIGAVLNFAVLGPLMIQHGDIVDRIAADGHKVLISRAEVVNQWSLWWSVTAMVVGSLVGLLARPEIFTSAFKVFKRKNGDEAKSDVLGHIELPLKVSFVGVPIFAALGAWATHSFFGVPWLLCVVSLPLILVLTVICTNSMALTSWTPTGALAKITQFTVGAMDRSNPANNLFPAGMTSEIAANAANLLSDIKPGYMLGAKPRQQAIGHVIGIFSGALACIPLFFLLFLTPDHNGIRSTATIVSDKFAFPSVVQWVGVAQLISKGISHLPSTALISMAVAAVLAAAIEIIRIKTKGKLPLSAVSIGLGAVLPPDAVVAMWLGAFIFWIMGRKHSQAGTKGNDIWVEGCEPICAGLIAGAALIGIGDALLGVLLE
ncbi:MAG: OPT/YSL family transporter [Burkholderiales bacterium]|nr:OPT/YSL family transporter [Burkholderiales bacterium]